MEKQPALGLVYKLCQELNIGGIAYCHWKSNAMLARSALGDNDLDLLVSRADVKRFTGILNALGFSWAQDPPEKQLPGVADYYGYDKEAARWVHVHAHYQLILGHDATKNYHLSIERPYLESAVQGQLFKIPAAEFELVVFVIRMVLKHSTWDTILGRQGTLSSEELQEMAYLQSRVSQKQISDILKQHLACIDAKFFDACIRSLQPNCSFWIRVRVGQQLQSRLRGFARRPQIFDLGLKLRSRVVGAIRRLFVRRTASKRLANGGLMVALVGGDGAGKTTVVDELHKWLSMEFATIKVHMGKPSWSWMTIAIRGFLKIGTKLGLYPFVSTPIQYKDDADSDIFPGYPWAIREVCTARDRYRTYVKARRFANNGGLVICDRFPLPQIILMDGPEIERLTKTRKANSPLMFLIEQEKSYYQDLMLPDLLIVLRTNPEIAVARKSDEDENKVRARSTEIWEMDWRQTTAHVIDANRLKLDIVSELKALVWSHL